MGNLITVRTLGKPMYAFVQGQYYCVLGNTLITRVANKAMLKNNVNIDKVEEVEHFTLSKPIETLSDFMGQVSKIIASN